MIDSAEEYRLAFVIWYLVHQLFPFFRFMKHELRNPTFLCPNLDKGNVCPACPKKVNVYVYVYFLLIC